MKHFDYLPKYENQLNELLGLGDISRDIANWRARGMDEPDMLCLFCRTRLERALKVLMEVDDSGAKLEDLICSAEDEDVIPRIVALKCHEIRVKGNHGTHTSVTSYDAKESLELFDDILRWFVGEDIDSSFANASDEYEDPIFVAPCVRDADELLSLARTAAALSGDSKVEKEAVEAREKARERSSEADAAMDEMAEMIRRAQELVSKVDASTEEGASVIASQEKLLDICDERFAQIKTECAKRDERAMAVARHIDEILSEHDFIKKLLKGDAFATPEQLDVMAFPKTQGSTTNILQIAGGAGTGKTLCLLAKVISEIDNHGQQSLFEEKQEKKALFVCFNKKLAGYVRELLAKYPAELPNIEITHFDEYINQLVRFSPKSGYEHLRSYAKNSRYPGWDLLYGSDMEARDYLADAMKKCALVHPDYAKSYILDSSEDDNIDWVGAELEWLESKYENPEVAKGAYLTAARSGRGAKHRPDAAARSVLIDVWVEYRTALERNKKYTIEQAVKRLLAEDSLPKYDAIAIDEVQDLSLISVKLLLKFRRTEKSMVFISGDENQKIYQRDFTWKELDGNAKGYTITLHQNKRNSEAIHAFSGRLLGNGCAKQDCSKNIHIQKSSDERVLLLLERLLEQEPYSTIALIGNTWKWDSLLKRRGIKFYSAKTLDYSSKGIHLLGDQAGKGLEFDCVVVDYSAPLEDDLAAEKNLRYVHFTRARHRLYVRYASEPPALLREYYADFLEDETDGGESGDRVPAVMQVASADFGAPDEWVDPYLEEKPGSLRARAIKILRDAYGERAVFYPGQLEAIMSVVEGHDSLVVQKTGWGKSLVYFIATKLLREDGSGPTVIISPLLALMENQIDSARRFGVRAVTINSENSDRWNEILPEMKDADAIIVSPERLSDESFMEHLADVRGINLIVVDEAHSISDWGHDFRPDYQRVSKLIAGMPLGVTVLGTTATANNRVIADIRAQLGENLSVIRGDLMRENLAIQVNPPQTREERLAWLSSALTSDSVLSEGQGIVYCLTHNDCDAVCEYLASRGVAVKAYYSGMGEDEFGNSIEGGNLSSFVAGETRVLVATVKLGMGYDKSDIRFVVHFQLPQNIIAYYQQIGRAGRDGEPSYAVLLHGFEDDEILNYFIQTAQALPNLLSSIVQMCDRGVSKTELLRALNVKSGKLDEAIKYLLVHDYIYKDGRNYRLSAAKVFDGEAESAKQKSLIEMREQEHRALLEYLSIDSCYMAHIARELDAPDIESNCGICANCMGHPLVAVSPDESEYISAAAFYAERHGKIEPRKKWASGGWIPLNQRMQPGWVLCADYYSEMGRLIKKGKYDDGVFSNQLVDAAATYLKDATKGVEIDTVVSVPSLRRPLLVSSFASELADGLGIRYAAVVEKTNEAKEQKSLLNSAQQQKNIDESTKIVSSGDIHGAHILLVDDMVDSKWTFTVIASKLLDAGAVSVHPFALVKTGRGD